MIELLDMKMLSSQARARGRAHAGGRVLDVAADDAREGVAARRRSGVYYDRVGRAGVITLRGAIGSSWWADAASADVVATLDRAAADKAGEYLIDMHCPGGSVMGMSDIFDAIERLREVGRVTAVAHDMMCSGGLYMAAHCDRIVATSTAQIGSIGVVVVLLDDSKFFDEIGFRTVGVTTGKAKLIGAPGVAIDDEMEAMVTRLIQPTAMRFFEAVSKATGMDVEAIEALNGEVFEGPEAMGLGLVDEVVRYHDLVNEMASGASGAAIGKGAAMAATTTKKTKAASAAKSALDVLLAKDPKAKAEYEARMAAAAAETEDKPKAESEEEPMAEDGMDDDEATEAKGGEDEAKAEDGSDDEDEPAAEDGDGDEEEPVEQGAKTANQGAAALASIEQLEALGRGDGFVVMAMKAKMTLGQAQLVAASWSAAHGSAAGGAAGGAGEAGEAGKAKGPRGVRPVGTAPAGAAAMGGDAAFLRMVAEYRQAHRCGEAAAIAAVKQTNPQEHRQWRAECQKQAAAMGQRMRSAI